MVLHQLDAVPVGVEDERHRHRPAFETLRCHRRFETSTHGALVHRGAVVDDHVDLPQRRAVLDWIGPLEMLCELQTATTLVGGEHRLVHPGDLGAGLHLQPDDVLVEAHRAIEIPYVDAVLPHLGGHRHVLPFGVSPGSVSTTVPVA